MKKVFSSQNVVIIGHLKNVLENNGIVAIIKNYFLSGGVGEIPPDECWPELWIMDDGQLENARTLIAENLTEVTGGETWRCSKCGEVLEGQFTQCWQCGHVRAAKQ